MSHDSGKQSERRKLIPVILLTLAVILILYLPGILNATLIPKIKRRNDLKRLKGQKVEIGDVLVFGEDTWTNTWRVLDVEGTKVLLINEKCVEFMGFTGEFDYTSGSFHAAWGVVYPYIPLGTKISPKDVWNQSGLKSWLNVDYYAYAFSDEEKALIMDRGLGKVFLLSSDEAKVYFPNEEDRIPGGKKDQAPWWLRSGVSADYEKYEGKGFAQYVSYYGQIDGNDICYQFSKIGVRPVIWLETDTETENE